MQAIQSFAQYMTPSRRKWPESQKMKTCSLNSETKIHLTSYINESCVKFWNFKHFCIVAVQNCAQYVIDNNFVRLVFSSFETWQLCFLNIYQLNGIAAEGEIREKLLKLWVKVGIWGEMQGKVCLHGNHQSVLLLFPVDMPLTTLD